MVGTTISHYKVLEKIGEGGMGEVYRATDTKLNRDVALKILPEQFASDSQRMGRFQREAEVLASLDHPNIGQIYGIEDAGQTKALVLQLIEGPTLAERIAQGPIPVEEALKIALQMAEGLEAAHEKGVIHRDLKPANIKITPEGQVKILDFGLAKALEGETPESSLSQSPTPWYLSLASFSRERSRSSRIRGWRFGGRLFHSGSILSTPARTSDTVLPPKVACLVSISNKTQPKAQTSAFLSVASPRACSGLM